MAAKVVGTRFVGPSAVHRLPSTPHQSQHSAAALHLARAALRCAHTATAAENGGVPNAAPPAPSSAGPRRDRTAGGAPPRENAQGVSRAVEQHDLDRMAAVMSGKSGSRKGRASVRLGDLGQRSGGAEEGVRTGRPAFVLPPGGEGQGQEEGEEEDEDSAFDEDDVGDMEPPEEDEASDDEELEPSDAAAWSTNPYADVVRTYHRRSAKPPAALAKSVDGILKGRNVAALNTHWNDMMESLKARNVSLMQGVRKRVQLREAHAGGQLLDVPDTAASTKSPPLLYGPNETLAHVLHGLYPSYGVASRIMESVSASFPGWSPTSMLDFGVGPGTATLAATAQWPDTLFDIVVVEPSRSMTQVAEHMLADTPGVMYRRSLEEVSRFHRGKTYDLIVVHYTLSQLGSDKEREDALTALWDALAPGGMLVLAEHGDRWGFHVVRTARDQLLQRAAAIAAFLPQLRADRALGPGNGAPGSSSSAAQQLSGKAVRTGVGAREEEGEEEDSDSAFDFSEDGDEEEDPIAARKDRQLVDLQQAYHQQKSRSAAIKAGSAVPTTSRDLAALDLTGPTTQRARSTGQLPPARLDERRGPESASTSALERQQPALPHASDVKAFLKGYAASHANSLAGGRLLRAPLQPELGAAVVGPCPHAHACPMPGNSWCHFSQAVSRHRKAGRSVHTRSLPSRVEKFSYVVLRKTDEACVEESPTFARAGWKATSGAFSFDEASLVQEGRGRRAEEEEEEDGHKGSQISGFSAGLGGGVDGATVLQMTRRGLEPDRWWLDKRPGRARGGVEEDAMTGGVEALRRVGGAGGRSTPPSAVSSWASDEDGAEEAPAAGPLAGRLNPPTAAEIIRATAAGRASAPSFSKPGARRAAFTRVGGEGAGGPALYSILDAEEGERRGGRAGTHAPAGRSGGASGSDAEEGEEEGEEEGDLAHRRVTALEALVEEAVRTGQPGGGQWARLVRAPLKRTGHVVVDVCTPQGTFERRVASKGKLKEHEGAYRAARRGTWGGLWPNWLSRRRDSDPGPGWRAALTAGREEAVAIPGAQAQLLAGGLLTETGVTAPAGGEGSVRPPPRDRSAQQRPSRRARRRAAFAMASDMTSLVTPREQAQAKHVLGMSDAMGVPGARALLEGLEGGGGQGGGALAPPSQGAELEVEAMLNGLRSSQKGRGEAASVSGPARVRGVDASAIVAGVKAGAGAHARAPSAGRGRMR